PARWNTERLSIPAREHWADGWLEPTPVAFSRTRASKPLRATGPRLGRTTGDACPRQRRLWHAGAMPSYKHSEPTASRLRRRMASFAAAIHGLIILSREAHSRVHLVATLAVVVAGVCLDVSVVEWC